MHYITITTEFWAFQETFQTFENGESDILRNDDFDQVAKLLSNLILQYTTLRKATNQENVTDIWRKEKW